MIEGKNVLYFRLVSGVSFLLASLEFLSCETDSLEELDDKWS